MHPLLHPPDWKPPPALARYDLVVLGGGAAGLVAAHAARRGGLSVALVERGLLGGDCLNHGCVPSKALLASARMGLTWAEARARTLELQDHIAPHDSAQRLATAGVHVHLGTARFVDEDAVEVNGVRLPFEACLVATGARPRRLEGALTPEKFFALDSLPDRLRVIGGGPVGCELAQAAAGFGCQVELYEQAPHLLPRDEPEAGRRLATSLGATIHVGAVGSVQGPTLAAIGRTPNTEALELSAAGLSGLVVNERLQTPNPRIYASGDAIGPPFFTHAADAMSRLVVENLLGASRTVDELVIPWVTYTSPEVAGVGQRQGDLIEVKSNDRSVLEGERGWVRVWYDGSIIRGASIVGPQAGELIGTVALAMAHGGMPALHRLITPYPTRSDMLRRVGQLWSRR